MGVKERRDTEKAEMKKKIINAAIDLIEQDGYEKLSIRKIAARIEYSPTTIYLYYKDKAEIITDMANELYHKVIDAAAVVTNENTALPIDKQVHSILCSFIKTLCSEPEMAKAIMYSGKNFIFANESPGGKPTNQGIELLSDLIEEGAAGNIFRSGTTDRSWMIISAILGFIMCAIENQLYLQERFPQTSEEFVNILMEGMKR